MPDEMQNENIRIQSSEDTGQQIKIRDHKRRTFSFFKTKKDGSETAAFRNYQHFKIGDTVEISYKNVPYKDGTIKNVLNMRPATGPIEESAPTENYIFKQRTRMGPGREYWEERDAKRQSSILMQVAFKAAVSLEAARVENGEAENKERMFSDTLEFYDWMENEIDGGEAEVLPSRNIAQQESTPDSGF